MIDRAAQKAARAAQASLRAASVPAKAAPAPKGRIAYDSVAASRLGARKPETASAWRVTPALPGVLPDATVADKQPLAMDYAPLYTSMGAGEFGGVGDGQAWLGFPLLSELAQRPEYRSVSETVAREMVRKWITLHSTGDDDKTDRIAAIMAGLERFKVRDTFRRLAEHDGFFGRGHLFIDTGDSDDAAEMQTPLVLDKRKIRKGSIKALKAVEPIWCYPAGYNATNPLAPDFYHPPIWYTNGRPVHRSRLLTFVGREVPDILKPAYQFGGVSMSQLIKPAVDNWLRVRESVGALVCAFSVFHLTTDMTSTLTGQGGDQLYLRAQMFNNYRSNDGLMITDKATEDFGNVSANLSTLDKLQAQSQEHIASIAKIPLVIYTGIGPTGLNASSEGDMEVWATNVQSAQWHLFGGHLRCIIDLIQLNECGDIDPEIGFSFVPLGEMSEIDRANLRKIEAETAQVMIGDGVLMPDEERARVAASPDSAYSNLVIASHDDPDAADPMAGYDPDAPVDPEADPDADASQMRHGKEGDADTIQQTSLNGAQVASMLEVIQSVVAGTLPRASAVALLKLAFQVSEEAAEAVLGSVGQGFVPSAQPDAVGPTGEALGAPAPKVSPNA